MLCVDSPISRFSQVPTSSQPNASSSETHIFLITGAFLRSYVPRPMNFVTADGFFADVTAGYKSGGRVKSDGFRGMGVTKFIEVGRWAGR